MPAEPCCGSGTICKACFAAITEAAAIGRVIRGVADEPVWKGGDPDEVVSLWE